MNLPKALSLIAEHPDYQVLKRVPEKIALQDFSPQDGVFVGTIIDLETMGMEPSTDEIIEIGLLSFAFEKDKGVLGVFETYNALNDPGRPIPEEIVKITGISDEDVKGKNIDWQKVLTMLNQSHWVICHNSAFDRNFLELQTPESVAERVKAMPFACTLKDIAWKEHGFESAKLDYLNWKLGYFYEGHRALNDCYATFNLFQAFPLGFEELKVNVKRKEVLLCAAFAPFEKKELLKGRNYRWSDGSGALPKSWYCYVPSESLASEHSWLDEIIYERDGMASKLPQAEINAKTRYSFRSQELVE
jgi:DNA polymerase-3 subunit epsilon